MKGVQNGKNLLLEFFVGHNHVASTFQCSFERQRSLTSVETRSLLSNRSKTECLNRKTETKIDRNGL